MILRFLIKFLLSAVIGCNLVNAANLNIKPCRAEDSICAKDSAQELLPILAVGVPDMGIEATDPLHFETIDLSTGRLKFILKDVTVKGVKDCGVMKIERIVAASKLNLGVQCYIGVDGDYEMSGQLLLLPVFGEGKTHMFLKKIELNVESDIEEIDIDGKKHWYVKSWTHNYDVKEKSDLVFENMFNGNPFLVGASREIFRAGWKEMVTELGPPLVKAVTEHVINNVNALFRAIPIDQLTIA